MTLGDFNGDGIVDLAFASSDHDEVYVTLGRSNGAFGAFSSFTISSPALPQVVLAGDFHHRGRDDLIVEAEISACPSGCFPVYLYTNSGSGIFTSGQPIVTPTNLTQAPSIAMADFNRDGTLDLAIDNLRFAGVAVYLGDGNGGFAAPAVYPTESAPWTLSSGDVNGDGIPDLITGNDIGSISILLGRGDGTFAKSASYTANWGPFWTDVGRYFGADLRDIVVLNGSENRNSGAVAYSLIRTATAGDPIAQLTTSVPALGPGVLADMDHDGIADLLVAMQTGVAILPGLGNGVFGKPLATFQILFPPQNMVVADFNRDGRMDFAACNNLSPGTLYVALQNANSTYAELQSSEPVCETVWAGDLNGDGVPDLLVLTDQSNFHFVNLSVRLGNGDGTFRAPIPAGPAPYTFTVGDFNGDGKPDVAFCNPAAGQPACPGLMFGNGDGTFQSPIYLNVTTQGQLITSGDFNGDGRLDLAVAQNPPGLIVLLGSGNGNFTRLPTYTGMRIPSQILVADLNGDGKQDLLTSGEGLGLQVYLGAGDGQFVAQTGFFPCVALTGCQALVGDLNKDGKPDIATIDYQDIAGPGAISALINITN